MTRVDPGAMLDGIRAELEEAEAEGKLAGMGVADLEDAMSHPKAPAVVEEIMATEAGSVKAGEPAPEIALPWLPGSEGEGDAFRLSDRFGERPVALVWGRPAW